MGKGIYVSKMVKPVGVRDFKPSLILIYPVGVRLTNIQKHGEKSRKQKK
jgi:hypothetical protein